ncbi:hypothetical protein ACFVJS_03975 [Nocardioides sp. NPDC057772]|uniref:hypothetical protein n=1 Tax=Nocardioides sp. NPDC057772 TaxID=3346245 RepID=UPI0036725C3E
MNHFARALTQISEELNAAGYTGPADELAEQIVRGLIQAGWREPLPALAPIEVNTGEKAPNPSERVAQLRALIPSKETTP